MTNADRAAALQKIALAAVNGEIPEVAEWLKEIEAMWDKAMPVATDEVKATRMTE